MTLTVTTAAASQRLTTRAAVKLALNVTSTADDALFDQLIDQASAAIRSYCHRSFEREAYRETLPGYEGPYLSVRRTPLVAVASIVDSNAAIYTDYSIGEADEGTIYRRAGWTWTAQIGLGLNGWQRFPRYGTPLPGREEPAFTVAYTAGYLLPPQNLLAASTVSAAAADNSFNDSAGGFPALITAGDPIVTSGFATAANNGRFLVAGTPTISKLVVTGGALALEVAPASSTVIVQTLPADVEKAAVEAVKSWYTSRGTDSNIVEKQVGPMRVRFNESGPTALPAACVGLLRPWVRMAA